MFSNFLTKKPRPKPFTPSHFHGSQTVTETHTTQLTFRSVATRRRVVVVVVVVVFAMGASCSCARDDTADEPSVVLVVSDIDESFHDALEDAFTIQNHQAHHHRRTSSTTNAALTSSLTHADAEALAACGELEMALWAREHARRNATTRRRSFSDLIIPQAVRRRLSFSLEDVEPATTLSTPVDATDDEEEDDDDGVRNAASWRTTLEKAKAFVRDEVEGEHEGWIRVGRRRRRSSVDGASTGGRSDVESASERESAYEGIEESDSDVPQKPPNLNHGGEFETFEADPSLDERLVVMYGRFAGRTVHSFKFSATFDAPPHRLVAVAREWDLMKIWNVYAVDAVVMLVKGLTHVVIYSAIWLPWPMTSRDHGIVIDACFLGQPPRATTEFENIKAADGFESSESSPCAVLLMRDVVPGVDDMGIGYPKEAAKRKRVDFVGNSGVRIRSLPPLPGSIVPRCRGDVVVHIDVKLYMVPASVVRFILKTLAPWVHRMIDKMLNSPKYFGDSGSMFQPRIDGNPELYGMLKRRLGETYAPAALAPSVDE